MPTLGRLLRRAAGGLRMAGLDLKTLGAFVRSFPRYLGDRRRFRHLTAANQDMPQAFSFGPILTDYDKEAGTIGGHYFHQDLWAARRIFQRRPARHVDVGSRIDGFIAHLLVFMPVELVDIRPVHSDVAGLSFVQADATEMTGFADNSVDSLSSLHAVEHFGLGRYGDPLSPEACFTAMRALARVLKPGGRLYFSVPIGRERVEFNANRIFAVQRVLRAFSSLKLVEFSAVDDEGRFIAHADPAGYDTAFFACGLFEFTKDAATQEHSDPHG